MFATTHGAFGGLEHVSARRDGDKEPCIWVRHPGVTLSMSVEEARAFAAVLVAAADIAGNVEVDGMVELPLVAAKPEAGEEDIADVS